MTFSELREKLYGRLGTLHMGQLMFRFMLVFLGYFSGLNVYHYKCLYTVKFPIYICESTYTPLYYELSLSTVSLISPYPSDNM